MAGYSVRSFFRVVRNVLISNCLSWFMGFRQRFPLLVRAKQLHSSSCFGLRRLKVGTGFHKAAGFEVVGRNCGW
jgi:hypothetical protein